MADKLTDKQRLAVHDRGGKLLVSAAAGSGKTKVLVERLMCYMTDADDPANVDDFLIVTFTKAAAAELRGKIAAAISERIALEPENVHLQNQMRRLYLAKISTVHGFCADVLKENAYRLDIPGDFRVGENSETDELRQEAVWSVLENAYENAWSDEDIQSFLDGNEFSRTDDNLAKILNDVYDSASSHVDPEGWLDECVSWAQVDDISDVSETIWGKYLINDLHRHLDMHIDALDRCLRIMKNDAALDKATAVIQAEREAYNCLRCADTWDETISSLEIQFDTLRFPPKFDDKELVESIKSIRNGAKDYLQKKAKRNFTAYSDQILQELQTTVGVTRGLVKLVKAYMHAYERLKKSYHILDFSDLEHRTLDLFWGKSRSCVTTLAKEVGSRFREVMVDEYQDTNAVQDGIFRALTMERNNCFMVGDVKQSIYQFRLADPSLFLNRYNRYNAAETAKPGQGRKVVLSDNFRSSAGVIDAVNDVFGVCMSEQIGGISYTGDEMLREGIPHITLGEPEVELYAVDAAQDAPLEEAAFVAQRIKELLDEKHMIRDKDTLRPIKPDDITILLRSTKTSSAFYQHALRLAGVPCATDNKGNILLTEEISDLHALLQVISNPQQDVALLATLVSRIFCFTANDLALLRVERPGGSLYECVRSSKLPKAVAFTELLTDFREKSRMCDVGELLNHIIRTTHFDSIYAALGGSDQRRGNIRKFLDYAYSYCLNGHRTLDQFLSHLECVQNVKTDDLPGKSSGVTIDTIHSSKGLEYPVVFLCDLSHNIRFEDNKSPVICHKELGIGFNCLDTVNRVHHPSVAKRAILKRLEEDALSEEMRILYVAMTRPKDRLVMTYCVKNLYKDLSSTVQKMPYSSSQLICSNALCLGDWVMYAALQKTEAGPLYAIAGNPNMGKVSKNPWLIKAVDGASVMLEEIEDKEQRFEELDISGMREAMHFTYPHQDVTKIPSKLTATQIKGRPIDTEITENAPAMHQPHYAWRTPLAKKNETASTAYGTAIHTIMEHICIDRCGTLSGVENEISRLQEVGLITPDQATAADAEAIQAFFQTEVGRLALSGREVLREFKFSILSDAGNYYAGGATEQVLLQGVIDFAVIDGEQIYLVDFKTDKVTDDTLPALIAEYSPQVNAYKDALEKIFMKKVASAQLYFYRLKKLINVQ